MKISSQLTINHLFDVNGVFQLLHVLMVGRDVKNGCDRVSQLDGEPRGLRGQLDWRVEAAGVAGEVVFVATVQGDEDRGFVVVLENSVNIAFLRQIRDNSNN